MIKKLYLFIGLVMTILLFPSCLGDSAINVNVNAIRVVKPKGVVKVGNGHQFEAVFINKSGQRETVDFAWLSGDPMIAQVDDSGLVSGLTDGAATIHVIAIDRNAKTSFIINVVSAE